MLLGKYYEGKVEAGCDEAGRGCLAGSVYAAAVILPDGYQNELLNDSKQLTEKRRYQLREIIERDAVAWAVGIVTPEEIDKINILNASILAMHRALDQLKVRPEAIIVDGNRFKKYSPPLFGGGRGEALPHTTIVKRQHPRQDLSRRLYESSGRGISPIRLALQQRLPHEEAPRSYQAVWHHSLPP